MLETTLFLGLALLAVGAAIAMVLQKNPLFSVLLLILTLFALAGLYVLLNSPFVAAVHMIVYAGAIMVLFLFVIMLLDLREDVERINLRRFSRIVAVIAVALFLVQAYILFRVAYATDSVRVGLGGSAVQVGDTPAIGMLLFTKYLLPFEIASVLLLAAIVGAVVLAKRKLTPSNPS